MSDILLLAAIVMLVLLFLKVPVYLAVLGGSMVYFALNPHVSAAELKKFHCWQSRFLSAPEFL